MSNGIPSRMSRTAAAGFALALVAACADAPTLPGGPSPGGSAVNASMGTEMDKEMMAMREDPGAHMVEYAEELVARYPAPAADAAEAAVVTARASLSVAGRRSSPDVLLVDDDGAQCPGALATIQEAVAAASAEATILVCPGTYYHTVEVTGAARNGLQIIANGEQSEVILQGPLPASRTEENGFFLRDVTGVTIRGFTVRGFGVRPTTAPVGAFGIGNNILLLRAHGNTISHNVTTGSDMMGIFLVDAGDNLIEHNVTVANDDRGLGCGIMLSGTAAGKALAANNVFRHNVSHENPLAGIMIRNGSTGTVVDRNNLNDGGRFGLQVWDTPGVVITRNVINGNRGLYSFPAAPQFSMGIDLRRSGGVLWPALVAHNVARGNGSTADSFDIGWDGIGSVTLIDNQCGTSSPAGLCERGSD